MNSDFEQQAKWHATKVILVMFSIIGSFAALMYISLIAAFILMAVGFVVMIAGAIYSDAYYSKLMELERNDQSRVN